MENHPGEGVVKEEKFLNTRKPSHWWVCGEIWNLREQHNREGGKTKKKSIDYMPKHNPQWRSSPDARICHQREGEGKVACLG